MAASGGPGAAPAARVAVFDLDGTITGRDTFQRFLISVLLRSPTRWARAPLLAWAVGLFALRRRDNHWLKAYFLRHIVGGQPGGRVARLAASHVRSVLKTEVLPRALDEVNRHRAAGARLVLASASPDLYTRPLGAALGFDAVVCTEVERDGDGRPTGRLRGGNCYGEEKRRRVERLLRAEGLDWGDVTAYSDHHADLPLLRVAGTGYAVDPSPRLRREAAAAGWPVLDWHEARRGPRPQPEGGLRTSAVTRSPPV